jgi:hypothetical protein
MHEDKSRLRQMAVSQSSVLATTARERARYKQLCFLCSLAQARVKCCEVHDATLESASLFQPLHASWVLFPVEPLVGDSVWDLLTARRAGCLGVGLLSGGYGKEELQQVGAYRVYQDPADLLIHLDEVGIRIVD